MGGYERMISNDNYTVNPKYNLSHPQLRIWYSEKINSMIPHHNIGGIYKIYYDIDVNVMQRTLQQVVKVNDILRICITEEDNIPKQSVRDYHDVTFEFIDFSDYEDAAEQINVWTTKLMTTPFHLQKDPLYRFAIYKNKQEYGIIAVFHHIIIDGWSISLIQKQINEIYTKMVQNQAVFIQYNPYLRFIQRENEYLSSNKVAQDKNFLLEKYKDVSEEWLYNSTVDLIGEREAFYIESQFTETIKDYINKNHISMNVFFITVILIYINRSTGLNDIMIGNPLYNRTNWIEKM